MSVSLGFSENGHQVQSNFFFCLKISYLFVVFFPTSAHSDELFFFSVRCHSNTAPDGGAVREGALDTSYPEAPRRSSALLKIGAGSIFGELAPGLNQSRYFKICSNV